MIITGIICFTVIYLFHWWMHLQSLERKSRSAYVAATAKLEGYETLANRVELLEAQQEHQLDKLNSLAMKIGFSTRD